jgi:hypothetical protein
VVCTWEARLRPSGGSHAEELSGERSALRRHMVAAVSCALGCRSLADILDEVLERAGRCLHDMMRRNSGFRLAERLRITAARLARQLTQVL